jgi:hypothetical protein
MQMKLMWLHADHWPGNGERVSNGMMSFQEAFALGARNAAQLRRIHATRPEATWPVFSPPNANCRSKDVKTAQDEDSLRY